MDPYYIQRLRDEVIYLHSLWHRGPPPRPSPATNLHPLNPPRFKKPKKKKPNFKPKKVGSFSGTEWPVKPPAEENPPLTESGWPELKLKPKPTRLPTPEELAKYNWNQVQQRALNAAKDFFSKSFSDGDDDDMDDDDDDDLDEKGYGFFWDLFSNEEELKGYYVRHCGGGGEFSCLVCGGANEKFGKRFKDCVALVQHSVSIAKTKKKISHRAYGRVICKVLGWDIDHLPSSIVSEFKSGELQGNDGGKDSNVGARQRGLESMVCENSAVVANEPQMEDTQKQVSTQAEADAEGAVNNLGTDGDKDLNDGVSNGILNKIRDGGESNLAVSPNAFGTTHDVENTFDGESMVFEISSAVACVEDTQKQVSSEAEGNAGGAVNNLCRNLSATMVLNPQQSR